jgi:two-component system phosphate regulon sensor histidine kinase PhoR
VLVLLRDLTQQQQIERMRADFVANASHELRTPLASVIGFIETLKGAARDDPEARARFLDLMQAQADRMRRLVDDLLSLSRIEMNAHRRPTDTVELGSTARQAIELLATVAEAAGVQVRLQCPEPVTVAGDRDELLQVVANLVENAVKYAASGKNVDVAVGREGEMATVAVTDYGPGIAPEHIPRLTERFYRVSVKDSRARGGTGLGLAIVKHILNRHRGKLRIESRRGHGSTFTVLLPAIRY